MTLLVCDGFDHYDQLADKWTGTGDGAIGSSYGRYGNGMRWGGNTGPKFYRDLGVQATTLYAGLALRADNPFGVVFLFRAGAGDHVFIESIPGGALRARRGTWNGPILLTSTPGVIPSYGWCYVEVKVVFDNTSGSVDFRVNGVSVGSTTAVDTVNTANVYCDRFVIGAWHNNTANSGAIDDVYCCDDAGSAPFNTWLGEKVIEGLLPNGAGNSTQWTPSAGSNYQCVDENPPDDDTTYVASSTVGHKDLYAMTSVKTPPGTIRAVVPWALARQDDAATRVIKTKIRENVTEGSGANHTMTSAYQYYKGGAVDAFPNNPDTGSPWTEAEVNAMECGVEVVT